MYTHHIYTLLYLSIYLSIYIYIYMYLCSYLSVSGLYDIHIYIYIYIYIYIRQIFNALCEVKTKIEKTLS